MSYNDNREPELKFPRLIQSQPLPRRSTYIPSRAAVNLLPSIAIAFAFLACCMALIVLFAAPARDGVTSPATNGKILAPCSVGVQCQLGNELRTPVLLPSPVQS